SRYSSYGNSVEIWDRRLDLLTGTRWLTQHACSKEKVEMAIISRGFSGRRNAADEKLPPGQYLTTDFPVLSAGPTPRVLLDKWEFTIDDGTNVLKRWDWRSFRELPTENIKVDLHCVTRWSKLGTHWEGVSLDTLFKDVKTDAEYALAHSYGDYT